MSAIVWDKTGERIYESGVDHGVLYPQDAAGAYSTGVAWNGLIGITESPSGAEPNPQYADNIKYLDLMSAEEFGATIEAYMYPTEFEECDGTAEVAPGVTIGQQNRKSFGMSYRTKVGNDVDGQDFGYKLHLFWGAKAAPSEKNYQTVNESPEATTFSWEVTTTPVVLTTINPKTQKEYAPTASMAINSTKVDKAKLASLEKILYGDAESEPRLPTPDEVIAIFAPAKAG